jgi:flagellar basal-body rod protein FlgB
MINPLFDGNKTNLVLQAALRGRGARHSAIVNNIANVDTPGYQRIEVKFEEELKRAARSFDSPAAAKNQANLYSSRSVFDRVRPNVSVDKQSPIRVDGSNVSIDREMADLALNAGKLNALTELLIRNYSQIKSAIKGRNN